MSTVTTVRVAASNGLRLVKGLDAATIEQATTLIASAYVSLAKANPRKDLATLVSLATRHVLVGLPACQEMTTSTVRLVADGVGLYAARQARL